MEEINLADITLDPRLQSRVELNPATVADYAEIYLSGESLPPISVIEDEETGEIFLWDGNHRYHAAKKAGLKRLPANAQSGTLRDAILAAAGANSAHGLQRTNADKRRAIEMLLHDDEWQYWSDSQIAKHCGVSHPTVIAARNSLVNFTSDNQTLTTRNDSDNVQNTHFTDSFTSEDAAIKPKVRTYTNKYGHKATMNVSNIGKKKTISSDNNSSWPDWTNRFHDPDDGLQPSIERISVMSPQDAAVLIVNAIYGNPNDARIPHIPGVTDNWDFRESFWMLMIDRARGQLGLDLVDDQ